MPAVCVLARAAVLLAIAAVVFAGCSGTISVQGGSEQSSGSLSGPPAQSPAVTPEAPVATPMAPSIADASSRAADAMASPMPAPMPVPGMPDAGPAPSAPAACRDRMGRVGDSVVEIPVDGDRRSALLHVPASYDPQIAIPLVLNFHGSSSDGEGVAAISNMTRSSDAHGFIVAYPNGIDGDWNCCGDGGPDDVAFVRALLDQLAADYCIDAARVFAAGFSNGGYMAYRLMCEMAEHIAAIGPVEAALGRRDCRPARAVSVIQFQGTDDDPVPYDEAVQANERARELHACTGMPASAYERGDVRCELWSQCASGSRVELCSIEGGGHQWAGGEAIDGLGQLTRDIDATETMVEFFGLR